MTPITRTRQLFFSGLLIAIAVVALISPAVGQLINFSKQQLIEYTPQNPFDRLPDGRPKVPDNLIERARGLSSEEIQELIKQGVI